MLLSKDQADQMRARVAAGEPKAAVARAFGISRETPYRCLERS
jgi:DNA invertase Pin-like site-specific DNA recombinase